MPSSEESDLAATPRPAQVVFSGENFGAQLGINHGVVENHFHPAVAHKDSFDYTQPAGLCLGQAPHIDGRYFVGRGGELVKMAEILIPDDDLAEQHRLVLGGTGGIGKTQLAIAYAKRYHDRYESVLWLNAATVTALETSLRSVAEHIFHVPDLQAYKIDQILVHVQRWLSDSKNRHWLLIFDNYDEPELYDIERYYPLASHGSIIVTTRLPDQISGQPMILRQFRDVEQSLQVLEIRSQRQGTSSDSFARRLAERLDGFPLALATAGAHLRKSPSSFEQYLQDYEQLWDIGTDQPTRLQEYKDRTLYTTWDISYRRLRDKFPDAARMLTLFAYFDHQAIWYELLRAGAGDIDLQWLRRSLESPLHFEGLMSVLVDHCSVETQIMIGAYSLHACVHDWTLATLNQSLDSKRFQYAFDCIYRLIEHEINPRSLRRPEYVRLVPHALRLTLGSFDEVGQSVAQRHIRRAIEVAELLTKNAHFKAAEIVYQRALAPEANTVELDQLAIFYATHKLAFLLIERGKLADAENTLLQTLEDYEQTSSIDHVYVSDMIHNLAYIYMRRAKFAEAEKMYLRALAGYEKACPKDDSRKFMAINNLALLYSRQQRLTEAEIMYQKVLAAGQDTDLDVDTLSRALNGLGRIRGNQQRIEEAEQVYLQALDKSVKSLGAEHETTLKTLSGLGQLYSMQGRYKEAEEMHMRALSERSKILGVHHPLTLGAMRDLALLYGYESKFAEAEKMYVRVLHGYEAVYGPGHALTLDAASSLGSVYKIQGRFAEAEEILKRVLTDYYQYIGEVDPEAQRTEFLLGGLYSYEGRFAEAEEMYLKVLSGYKKVYGADHVELLTVYNNLGILYDQMGRFNDAEDMYLRAVAGPRQESPSREDHSLNACFNLGLLYRHQSQPEKAKDMFRRAADGYLQLLGPDHSNTLKAQEKLRELGVGSETGSETKADRNLDGIDRSAEIIPSQMPITQAITLPKKQSRWKIRLGKLRERKGGKEEEISRK